MKKLYIIVISSALFAGNAVAFFANITSERTVAGHLKEFKSLMAKQKGQWIDFKKAYHDKMWEMKKEHIKRWTELGSDFIDSLESSESKDAVFHDHLKKALDAYKQKMEAWKNWCDKEREEANRIYEAQQQELANFEKSANITMTPTPETKPAQ